MSNKNRERKNFYFFLWKKIKAKDLLYKKIINILFWFNMLFIFTLLLLYFFLKRNKSLLELPFLSILSMIMMFLSFTLIVVLYKPLWVGGAKLDNWINFIFLEDFKKNDPIAKNIEHLQKIINKARKIILLKQILIILSLVFLTLTLILSLFTFLNLM